jgi:6-phosphofructokinase
MIREKIERRWECIIDDNDKRGAEQGVLMVNSIDGDLKHVKVTMGGTSKMVSVVDIIDLLKRVAANTNGVPAHLC